MNENFYRTVSFAILITNILQAQEDVAKRFEKKTFFNCVFVQKIYLTEIFHEI